MKSRRKLGNGGAVIGFLVLALVFWFVSGKDKKFLAECKETTGEITRVDKRVAGSKFTKTPTGATRKKYRYEYHVTFNYTIDGQPYENTEKLDHELQTGPHAVYYLPDKPDDGQLEKPSLALDYFVMIGSIAAAIGFGINAFRKGKEPPPAAA